jgi:hypothetical protein
MHTGSGSGFGSGFNIKWNTVQQSKKSKIENEMTTFWETILLLTIKRRGFVPRNFLEIC